MPPRSIKSNATLIYQKQCQIDLSKSNIPSNPNLLVELRQIGVT